MTSSTGPYYTPWPESDESGDRDWDEDLLSLIQGGEDKSETQQPSVSRPLIGYNEFQKNNSCVPSQLQASCGPGVAGGFSSGPAHITPGSKLHSSHVTYLVHAIIGEGTYGKIAKCTRKDTNSMVALKIIKNNSNFIEQANDEVDILNTLKHSAQDAANIVQLNHYFFDRGHFCLEFELLDIDLFDYMKQRAFCPLPLKEIRPIVHQLASALQQLKTIGIIHGDLKLENVMLVDHLRQPGRVKIIDFGLACHVSAATLCSVIQSREYRSPEVMLGLPFSVCVDMWSLGCIAAFLFLGSFLYYGMCEYEMMRYIVETQGYPPDQLLKAGIKTSKFFCRSTSCTDRLFRLKTPAEYQAETGFQSVRNRRFNSLNDLQQFKHPIHQTADLEDTEGRGMFVYMLKAMLELEASRRISPRQVLQLPFFNTYRTSNSRNAASSHHPVHHHIPPHPCNQNQSQSPARTGQKRTRDEDDSERDDYFLSGNDRKRSTQAGPRISSSQDNQTPTSRPWFDLIAEGVRVQAEHEQTPRGYTQTRPEASSSSDQARTLSLRPQLWNPEIPPEIAEPCAYPHGPNVQNSSSSSSLQLLDDRGGIQKVYTTSTTVMSRKIAEPCCEGSDPTVVSVWLRVEQRRLQILASENSQRVLNAKADRSHMGSVWIRMVERLSWYQRAPGLIPGSS